ncbi:MAG: fibronectin type III domain-containing protein [Candidatus Schekmanbacteria bacterium]|nr:fibronectin type III domain-containing protein [Candidatus Schekmanbacteria bacterium]
MMSHCRRSQVVRLATQTRPSVGATSRAHPRLTALLTTAWLVILASSAAQPADLLPDVTQFQATVTASGVVLTWSPPATSTEGKVTAFTVRRNVFADGYPMSPLAGDAIGQTAGFALTDATALAGTAYAYSAFVIDLAEIDPSIGASVGSFARTEAGDTDAHAASPLFVWGPLVGATACEPGCSTWTALIQWSTATPATAVINYGTGVILDQHLDPDGYATSASAVIAGLAPADSIDVEVCVTDIWDQEACAAKITASPPDPLEAVAPILEEAPIAVGLSELAATLTWPVSTLITPTVELGTTQAYGESLTGLTATLQPRIELTGLDPETTYHVRVSGVTPSSAALSSADFTFSTPPVLFHDRRPATSPPQPPSAARTITASGIPWVLHLSCDSFSTTLTSALLEVELDQPASVAVRYGPEGSPLAGRIVSLELARKHELLIPELGSNTRYTFDVEPRDRWGKLGAHRSTTCRTRRLPPVGAFQFVEGPVADARRVTATTAVVEWMTSRPTTSAIAYDDETARRSSPPAADRRTATKTRFLPGWRRRHRVVLTELTPGSDYTYIVSGTDLYGRQNEAAASLSTWASEELPEQCFVNPGTVSFVSDSWAFFEWELCRPMRSLLHVTRYPQGGPRTHNYDYSVGRGEPDMKQEPVWPNLPAATEFAFEVNAVDTDGTVTAAGADDGADFATSPSPDTTPPVIGNVVARALSPTLLLVSWETDEPTTGMVEFGGSEALDDSATSSGIGRSHRVYIAGLDADQMVYYRVVAVDLAGLTSVSPESGAASADMPLNPDAISPKVTSAFSIETDDRRGVARVRWTTDEPARSVIRYLAVQVGSDGETTPLPGQVRVVASPRDEMSHELWLVGLRPGTSYALTLQLSDFLGNRGADTDMGVIKVPVPLGGTAPMALAAGITLAACARVALRRAGRQRQQERRG